MDFTDLVLVSIVKPSFTEITDEKCHGDIFVFATFVPLTLSHINQLLLLIALSLTNNICHGEIGTGNNCPCRVGQKI